MSASTADVAPIQRMLITPTRAQLITRLRIPAFSVLSLGMPVMFFALFNGIFGRQTQNGVSGSEYILVSYATYAVANVMVYNFGIGIANERGRKLDLLRRLLLGSFPMIGIGMAIGYGVGPNAAPAVVNVFYLPMAFLSGIFFPLRLMPDVLQKIGHVLPTYHYAQLGYGTLGQGVADEGAETALVWLAAWTIVLFAIAVRIYRVDESRKFS